MILAFCCGWSTNNVWYNRSCKFGTSQGVLITLSTYGEESFVYREKAFLFWGVFFQKAPLLLLRVLPSGRGKKQINTMWISHRISLNDVVLQQDKSQKMTYFLYQNKTPGLEKLECTAETCIGLTCSRSPLAAQDALPHLLFLLFPSQSSW